MWHQCFTAYHTATDGTVNMENHSHRRPKGREETEAEMISMHMFIPQSACKHRELGSVQSRILSLDSLPLALRAPPETNSIQPHHNRGSNTVQHYNYVQITCSAFLPA